MPRKLHDKSHQDSSLIQNNAGGARDVRSRGKTSTAATGIPSRVRKRDGSLARFDPDRIRTAVEKAALEVGADAARVAASATELVLERLVSKVHAGYPIPSVEEIQDLVEQALADLGYWKVARAFATYRKQRTELRETKRMLGVRDELKLSLGATLVLRERYLRRNERGRIVESTGEMMDRVAHAVAAAEQNFSDGKVSLWAQRFSELLRSLRFLPNSPTLMNAGTPVGMLSGCFVLPIDDSLRSIFETMTLMALVHQAGGGTGFSFSAIRPKDDLVRSTGGRASGPLSFLRLYDSVTDTVKQGGRRRGANMAVMSVTHPDIVGFIESKRDQSSLQNFNLSVGVTDSFMRKALRGDSFWLINPRNKAKVAKLDASRLLDQIAEAAWSTGDPGLLFLDEINRRNPLPSRGRIEATNPCGEVPLLPYESCNLGSINLARHISNGRIDWRMLAETIQVAVRFLDNVIEINKYPDPRLDEAARLSRKVGLGVMGLAETFAALGIAYDSDEALRLARRLAAFIRRHAHRSSVELAVQRGPFPLFPESRWAKRGAPPMRNAQLTSIAPTGTISLIAGTTSGIEPMFAIGYVRHAMGRRLTEVNQLFERLARERGFYSEELMARIAVKGGVRDDPAVPEDIRSAFVTAFEVAPEWHLKMQATFQRYVDAAVSKTVNLPESATPETIRSIFVQAWRLRVKGITVYRYGSKPQQVLELMTDDEDGSKPPVAVQREFSGGCMGHICEF
jgi:ribonucleoside-diphosphate reductase alpha chain